MQFNLPVAMHSVKGCEVLASRGDASNGLSWCFGKVDWPLDLVVELGQVHAKSKLSSWLWNYHKWMTPFCWSVSNWLPNTFGHIVLDHPFDLLPVGIRDGPCGRELEWNCIVLQLDLHRRSCHGLELLGGVEHVLEFLHELDSDGLNLLRCRVLWNLLFRCSNAEGSGQWLRKICMNDAQSFASRSGQECSAQACADMNRLSRSPVAQLHCGCDASQRTQVRIVRAHDGPALVRLEVLLAQVQVDQELVPGYGPVSACVGQSEGRAHVVTIVLVVDAQGDFLLLVVFTASRDDDSVLLLSLF